MIRPRQEHFLDQWLSLQFVKYLWQKLVSLWFKIAVV
uniref:Uncharacterized protein n=1 Tax=Anguilla anguilla TaxID=7936 RepID=A0A0E9VKY9_ANGAN